MDLMRICACALAALTANVVHAEEFTGDVKLACEALLCLSSGSRPNECSPSLSKYFSIDEKKMSDTIKGRLNFLNLCPTASYDSNMKSLTNAIAHGAGRCDAAFLNTTLKETREIEVCGNGSNGSNGGKGGKGGYGGYGGSCHMETITVISNKKPAYCVAYDGHAYTYDIGASYVGTPEAGGHWGS